MHNKFKCFISILLSFTVIIGLVTVVSAVEPKYLDTNSVLVTLVFKGTTAYCSVNVSGADGTTSVTDGHLILTDSNGNIAGDWSNKNSYTSSLFISESVSGLTKGEMYTLSFSANVNRNGRKEPVSGSSTQTCPNK